MRNCSKKKKINKTYQVTWNFSRIRDLGNDLATRPSNRALSFPISKALTKFLHQPREIYPFPLRSSGRVENRGILRNLN